MIGIILINYFSEEELLKYIENELIKIEYPHKVVIVNNSHSYRGSELIRDGIEKSKRYSLDKNIFLITKKTNLGYSGANNYGAEFLYNKFSIKYLLFSNTDIEIKSVHIIKKLIKKISDLSENVSAIGPKVLGSDGIVQGPRFEVSFIRFFLKTLFPFLKRFGKVSTNTLIGNDGGICHWVSGCFIVIDAEDFFNVGMFDENVFLYCEEKIFAEKLKNINKYNYYYPMVNIIHHTSSIVSKNYSNSEIAKLNFKSEIYYYANYKGVNSFLIKILTFCGFKKIDENLENNG